MFFHYNDLKCAMSQEKKLRHFFATWYEMVWYKTTEVYIRHIVRKHNQEHKIAEEISMKITVQK